MKLHIRIALAGLTVGILIAFLVNLVQPMIAEKRAEKKQAAGSMQVIGFLPYWLLNKAQPDYSSSVTTLTYFGLGLAEDGHIIKLTSPTETDPGWYALSSGAYEPFLQNAKEKKIKNSLLIVSGNAALIEQVVADPVTSANNLMTDVLPVMRQHGFTDLNLDIEYTKEASPAAQQNFTTFVRTVKNQLTANNAGTLTVEISPLEVIKHGLTNLKAIGALADYVVLMAYDYHSTASFVTGAVAPQGGGGTNAEYDVATAIYQAKEYIPTKKLILGLPLYGYEWETLTASPRAAIIPGTGQTASSMRVQNLLSECATCSATYDKEAEELYVSYLDQTTNTYHQMYIPNKETLSAKMAYAKEETLGGLALWALGYEDQELLTGLFQQRLPDQK